MRYLECWCCGRFSEHLHSETKKCYPCNGIFNGCGLGERFQPPKKSIDEIEYELYYHTKIPPYIHPDYIIVELDE